MNFDIDKQTLQDLDVFSDDFSSKPIFNIFNNVKTIGGRKRLLDMMQSPSSDREQLIRRIDSINYFYDHSIEIKITNAQFDFIDHYLKSNFTVLKNNKIDIYAQLLKNKISNQKEYYIISTGVKFIFYALKNLLQFLNGIENKSMPPYLQDLISQVNIFTSQDKIIKIIQEVDLVKRDIDISLTTSQVFKYDVFFRKKQKENFYENSHNRIGWIYRLSLEQSTARPW